MEKRTEVKTFTIWNLEKEEKWLNQMEAEGWHLVDVYNKNTYKFEECEPGKYVIRIEFLKKSVNNPESEKYIDFIGETGANYISNRGNIVYFSGLAEKEFELFSDNTSRINYYSRIIKWTRLMAVIWWINTFMNLLCFFGNLSYIRWIYLVTGLLTLFLAVFNTIPFVKFIKKRKVLKEQKNLFE